MKKIYENLKNKRSYTSTVFPEQRDLRNTRSFPRCQANQWDQRRLAKHMELCLSSVIN